MKFNNETIRTAVQEWLENSKKGEKKYGHISYWDVSNVTNMDGLFYVKDSIRFRNQFGSVISQKQLQKTIDSGADISDFNLKEEKIISKKMLNRLESFNDDISMWNVRNVTSMKGMFKEAKSFNQNIGNWDVSNVIDMSEMFYNNESFNKDIGNWNVSNVTNMQSMFNGAQSFNQDISRWNTSNVKDMYRMFWFAKSFNQDIGAWDVSNVNKASAMFAVAEAFNQDLSSWNVRKDADIEDIFAGAISFNQNTDNWKWFNLSIEESEEEIIEVSFKKTTKLTDELKKYIDSHNDTAVIEVFPSNGGVREEYIHTGSWNNKNFKMKVSIPLKNAEYQYDGNLSNFIEQIGTKKITDLDDSNLDLDLLGDSGGSFEVDEITWDPELTDEEENEVDEYNLVDFGIDYDEDDFIFEKGCIYEIRVTIGDKIFTLVK